MASCRVVAYCNHFGIIMQYKLCFQGVFSLRNFVIKNGQEMRNHDKVGLSKKRRRITVADEKHVFHFDFDQTLTTEHVEDWFYSYLAPNQARCKELLKPGVPEAFRYLHDKGYPRTVITN